MIPTKPPTRRHFAWWTLGWTAFVVYGSLVPLEHRSIAIDDAIERFRNLPPLWFGMGSRADWVANILLFVPLTFGWMAALSCDRGWPGRILAALIVTPTAITAAILLEFTQIWFPARTVSRNDIVAEALGACIGTIAWLALGQLTTTWLRRYSAKRQPKSRMVWLLQAYLAGFIIVSVLPLDLTISLTDLFHKFEDGRVTLVPFGYRYDSVFTAVYQLFADVIVFVPVGMWAAMTQRHRLSVRSPFLAAAILGGVIAATIELAQLFVLSRYTNVTDIVLGAIGSGVGGWVSGRTGRQPVVEVQPWSDRRVRVRSWLPWVATIAGYSLFLMAGFWFPFELTHDRAVVSERFREFFRVPFLSLYVGNEFNAVSQLLIRVLLFAPVGVLWANVAYVASTTAIRGVIIATGILYSACLAAGIEAVQILMPPKVADLTDLLLCFAGALGGLAVALRLLSLRHAVRYFEFDRKSQA